MVIYHEFLDANYDIRKRNEWRSLYVSSDTQMISRHNIYGRTVYSAAMTSHAPCTPLSSLYTPILAVTRHDSIHHASRLAQPPPTQAQL